MILASGRFHFQTGQPSAIPHRAPVSGPHACLTGPGNDNGQSE